MWTPSVRTFRIFAVLSTAYLLFYVVEYHWQILPLTEDAERAMRWSGANAMLPGHRIDRAWYLIYGVMTIGFCGMIRFHDWARWAALIANIADIFLSPAYGLIVSPALHNLLHGVGNTFVSVTLAMAFLSPSIAGRFNGESKEEHIPPADDD